MAIKTFSYFDRLEKHSAFFSPTGNGTIEEYQLKFDKDTGSEILVKIGIKNTDDYIQSFAASADITNILTRFVNGETDLLNASTGAFVDVTSAPTSYAEYFARVREAEKIFNQLPDDVKDRFDNDAEKFFLEFGTDSFIDKVDNNTEIVDSTNVIKEDFDNAE